MREASSVRASHRCDRNVRPAPDLVYRNFVAQAANDFSMDDITRVPTAADFLKLAVVLDAFSRRIAGSPDGRWPTTFARH